MRFKSLPTAERGFTLIELVVIIVLLSITSAAIIHLNGGLFKSDNSIRDLQSDTQLLQACAEHVISTRRLSGFNGTPDFDASCEALPVATKSDNNNFEITTTSTYTGNSCPINATCQLVEIKVNSTMGTIGPMTLQLMKY